MTALISATRLSSRSGGRPIRFFVARSRMRSIRLERETPITTAMVFIANRPSAATAAAAAHGRHAAHAAALHPHTEVGCPFGGTLVAKSIMIAWNDRVSHSSLSD